MSELINVKDKAPEIPCIAADEYSQIFILRDMVTATDAYGSQEYYDGSSFNPGTMKFRNVVIDGKPAIIKRKVKYWMPLPKPPKEASHD